RGPVLLSLPGPNGSAAAGGQRSTTGEPSMERGPHRIHERTRAHHRSMKPATFEYVAATSLDEAVGVLAQHGDEAKVIAGGQSLVPMMAFRLATPAVLVDLNRVTALEHVRYEGDALVLGAMARHRDVQDLPGLGERCAMLAEGVDLIGHRAIRNRGTGGG